jgi:hypothetical protein
LIVIRPPYGQANEITAAKLDTKGYNIVIWSTDTRDFESHNLKSERANFEESMTDLSSGYITLSHDVCFLFSFFFYLTAIIR